MIRSLTGNWKYWIYFDLDMKFHSTDEYYEMLGKFESTGAIIKSLTCDMGGANQGLYKRLGVKLDHSYIMSPTRPDSKIHCMYDSIHCYKNFFASLMDNIALNPETGHSWSKRDFEELLEQTNSEITPLFRYFFHHEL